MPHFKIVVNCGPCAEYIGPCLESIRAQSHADWKALVTVDPCGDDTIERARKAAGRDSRIRIKQNPTQRHSLYNLVHAIRRSRAKPEHVIASLDGDDWFSTRDALAAIADAYERHDCWMTYGSWLSNVTGPGGRRDGAWPAYPEGTTNFRNTRWLATAVRTWKRWLWDYLKDADLRDGAGKYFRIAEDQAVMLPLLEMSGTDRARHIAEPIMVYNKLPKYTIPPEIERERERNGELLGRRPSYERLEKPRMTPSPQEASAG
jgi:glycosyltransferase involved in cell wall biosynthesis